MELSLSTEERELLLNILEQRHRELFTEIRHTAHREFGQRLRRDEKLLESLESRLRATAAQAVRG